MEQQEFGDPATRDAEWRSRLRESARADVRAAVRAARRRRLERWLVTSMVLVAIVAVLMLVVRLGSGGTSVSGGPSSGAPDQLRSTSPTIDRSAPFTGTPAAHWADGADGIVVPPPMRVGEFSADEVAAATNLVRDALVASRIDPAMLVRHDPSHYLGLLAPDARAQLAPLFGSGREPEAQSLVSLVASGVPLLPAPPKVSGSMRVETGGPGELVVRTNYVFAYAFDAIADHDAGPMDIIVVVRAEVEYIVRSGPRWTKSSQGLWYGAVGGYGYSIACDAYKRGFLAPAHLDAARPTGTAQPRQDTDAYFDPTAAIPSESGCPTG